MEKVELELFRAGQFEDKDEEVEDASAPAVAPPPEPPKVINHINEFLEKKLSRFHSLWKMKKFLELPSIYLLSCRKTKLLPVAREQAKRYK